VADFKTALEALAKGNLDVEVLAKQLTSLLDKTPQYANRMLSHLDEMHDQKGISDQDYARLKRQINQYRRTHTAETETGSDVADESTVFAQEDNVQDNVAAASNADEATQVIDGGVDDAATQVLDGGQQTDTSGFDVTGATDMSGVDVDLSAIGDPSVTSATGPADTAWSDPSAQSPTLDTASLGPGSIIKQRFKLIKVLGIGGMGKVYMGLDLLKEEARDKKPYCAIKLLNEDFKDHPEAFISLQRESSRQQKLAHPNIATIYDFDRIAGPGTPVYITMELMEGMELKDFIKKTVKKQGGLPFDEAFGIIKQLVDALAYAHDKRLVHSDLKPGNAFYCNDGTVKILDFGIARAVKNPVTGEAEKTLFDPGQLGALTPAYASYEMLEGEEPDTRDDTYALGCMAYELLTGKHPFNKLPANKAKENNLKPPIIKGLKKKQNRALQRSIAFERKDRSPTVEHFLEEFEARFIWYKSPLTIAAILFVLIGLGGTLPVMNYYHQKEIDQIVADINTGNPQVIVDRLGTISGFEKADQRTITEDAKKAIQTYFTNQITGLTDTSGDEYNFPKAELVLAKAGELYPDTNFYQEQSKHISVNKKQQLSKLYSEFSDALVLANEQGDATQLDNTKSILNIIGTRIDPNDSLLTDPRASNQYRRLANNEFDLGNLDQAMKLISSGIELAPKDEQLIDARNKIETAVKIVGLEEKLDATSSQLVSLDDYQQIKGDVIVLAELDADSSTLVPIASSMQDTIQTELENIMASGNRADAETLAGEYGDMLSALQLGKELSQIKLAHLEGAERTTAIQEIVAADKTLIEQSLAEPKMEDPKWESKMLASVRELGSLSEEDTSIAGDLENIRESIVKLFISEAEKTLEAKRFDAANNFIDRGERFAPDYPDIVNTRDSIAEAEIAHEKKLLVDGLIKDFKAQTEANQVAKALDYYEQLKTEVPDDGFVTQEAPRLLSSSYENLAKSRFEAKDYVNALRFADEGMKFNPDNRVLKSARTEYVVEANIIDLTNQFKAAINFDNADVQRKIAETSSSLKYSKFRQDSIKLLEGRINSLRTSNENAAATLAQNAAIFFPGTVLEDLKNELKLKPWPNASIAATTLNTGRLTEANALLQTAVTEFPEHPEVDAFRAALEARIKEANDAFNAYQSEKDAAGTDYKLLRSSKKTLSLAQSRWTDNPDYDTAETELDGLIAANKPAAKKVIAREVVDLEAVAKAEPGAAPKEWKPADSGRGCEPRLAGYGKRAKAICYDFVNTGWRGPLMVVMPTGGEFNKNFAISKYEISVGDYSKYCAITKSCTPERNKEKYNDPLTNISLAEAKAYATWVSGRTGKTYRLPTTKEWEYAANSGGKQPKKDYNCRVALGDKIIKGTGIVSIKSGQSNGWGLKNYIGNVQEWVVDGDNITARGGAFQDSHSKCKISFSRDHNGGADDKTGFRLILEDAG
jgi:serine/threonine protein kinase